MQQYLTKVGQWLPTGPADLTGAPNDTMLTQHLLGGAAAIGMGPDPSKGAAGLSGFQLGDPNSAPNRDSATGFYNIPMTQKNGVRTAVRDFIVSTVNSGFPLTVRTNSFVTKLVFNTTGATPQATGVQFLDGAHLYRASPLSGGTGTAGTAMARKEVIVSGGVYNTVQLLKLSGIGPKAELSALGINTLVNSPGVGINMQDRYEIPVNVIHPNDFPVLTGCTFDGKAQDSTNLLLL
jgi:choline dehydrogenase